MQKILSIAEYAAYILNDSRVSKLMVAIKHSNAIADNLIATLADNVSKGDGSFYKKTLVKAKHQSMLAIIQKGDLSRWALTSQNVTDIVNNQTNRSLPGYADLPLVMFWHFVTDIDFQAYLLGEKLPWFKAPLPSDREAQFVISLFLWLKMESQIDKKTGRQYYTQALRTMPSLLVSNILEVDNSSSIETRRLFLELFSEFIHTDVWTADDYALKNKEGIVIRLRLSTAETGLVVVQSCAEKATQCNNLYKVTETSLRELNRLYLSDQSNRPSKPSLKCAFCGCNDLGSLFYHPKEMKGLYCGIECYNKCV